MGNHASPTDSPASSTDLQLGDDLVHDGVHRVRLHEMGLPHPHESPRRSKVMVGLTASLPRQMTYSVTRFGAYDKLKEMTLKQNADGKALGPLQMALCASAAGAAGGLAGNPADILLVRMTSDVNKPAAERYNYPNAITGLVRMTRDDIITHI